MRGQSVNLLAWLRPEQVHVSYAGRSWELEATCAADWIGAIIFDTDSLAGVFPGLIRDDDVEAMSTLLQDPENLPGLQETARSVVQAAGGRDWWWTVNLIKRVIGQWIYVNGILVRQGVRADGIGLPDWLDACYTWLWERSDENERVALDAELSWAPKGVRHSKRQIEQMVADFAAD